MAAPIEPGGIPSRPSIHDALNATIAKYNLVASQLAQDAKLTPAAISRFRTGQRDITTKVLQQILEVLPKEAYLYFLQLMALGTITLEDVEPALKNSDLPDDLDLQNKAVELMIARYAAQCTPDKFDHLLGIIVDSRRHIKNKRFYVRGNYAETQHSDSKPEE